MKIPCEPKLCWKRVIREKNYFVISAKRPYHPTTIDDLVQTGNKN